MREWQSQSHVRWYCRYHVVWVPKNRKRSIFGQGRRGIGKIVRELCQRPGVELVEGHALSDHVHVLLGIPPKLSVANTVGFLKGKSAIRIHREYLLSLCLPKTSSPHYVHWALLRISRRPATSRRAPAAVDQEF